MDKINFQNGVTKVNADTFNTFQNNIEKSAVIVSKNEPTTNEKVWFRKGKNLLKGIIPGYEFSNSHSGDTNVNENWFVTEFVQVEAGKEYYVQGFSNIARWWFDENKNFIILSNENPCSAPSNAKYVRLNGEIASSSNMMIFQGNAETIYEPYIEPKIYVKNDNGVYEEFYKKEEVIEETLSLETGNSANGLKLKKYSNIVNLSGKVTGLTGQWLVLSTIPAEYRPKEAINFNPYVNANYVAVAELNTAGQIILLYKGFEGGNFSNDSVYINLFWII